MPASDFLILPPSLLFKWFAFLTLYQSKLLLSFLNNEMICLMRLLHIYFFLYFWINNTFTIILWIYDFGQNTSISFKHSLIPKIYGWSVFQRKKTHFSNAFYSSHLFFTHFLPCFWISSVSVKLSFVSKTCGVCLFACLFSCHWDESFVVLSGCKSLWLCR